MYKKILVALENGPADATLLPHVGALARQLGAELLLMHVADGFAARNFHQLKLAESDEMKADRDYLDRLAEGLRATGVVVTTLLALGNPPTEILRHAANDHCDLIAMTSHGHKIIGDFFLGSTIDRVRHNTRIPLLILRAERPAAAGGRGGAGRASP
ncbi:universal stress protein [Horticoccus luteus]|uniref:Universal stress protein n=1 Tax=Horticoccus luteus TaxID=2862869 RepID=A0A8F9TY85_9BACT|nr:universal stress protein [Horticoccus luteus]QYM80187.1 universal stress protein [Horticoccus luteus]